MVQRTRDKTPPATCPWDVRAQASRGASTALSAVLLATAKLRERLFELAVPSTPRS
ncbi:MAG: hypothetical protein HYX75_04170 [Acidobacteria bacterium]|nr:hypothetical protein [Acidobacteriota bacterium]